LTNAQGAVLDMRPVRAAIDTVQMAKGQDTPAQSPETPRPAKAPKAKDTGLASGIMAGVRANVPSDEVDPAPGQPDLFAEMRDAAKAEAIALTAEVKAKRSVQTGRQAKAAPVDPATRAAEVDASNALAATRQATQTAYSEAASAGYSPAECRQHAGLPAECQHTSEVDRAWCPACEAAKRLAASQATPVDTAPTPKAASPASPAEETMCPAEGCDKRASVCPQHRAAPKGASIVDAPAKAPKAKAKAR